MRLQMKYLWANKILFAIIVSTLLAAPSVQFSVAQIPQKPAEAYPVNDYANILTNNQRATLNNMLSVFADTTSNRIVIVTIPELGEMSPNEFATELGEKWGVGNSQFDNGIVLLVKPKTANSDGQVYIAVGYGLEGAIPDIIAQQIVQKEILPHFRNNDYYSGITAATVTLMKLASGEISYKEWSNSNDTLSLTPALIFFIILILFSIFGKSSNHSNGRNSGRTISSADAYIIGTLLSNASRGHSSGSWGGGSFGGGGFGGGFGGGSFGGGGAGGSW